MAKLASVADVKDGAVYILQPGTPVYLKTADVCALFGKSYQWIGQLTSQGTLSKKQTPHGAMYELSSTVRDYIDMLNSRTEEKRGHETEADRRKAEAELKQAKAIIAKMDAAERQGSMHRSEDVAAMTEDLIYTIRSALLALPGRLAVYVAMEKDAAEVADVIRGEAYRVMEELSHYQYDAAKYQERVRERLRLEAIIAGEDDDED